MQKENLKKVGEAIYKIEKDFRDDMKVPAWIFATAGMLDDIMEDRSLDQLVNVATMPGAFDHVLALPDIHEGYGFPIGGVAAIEAEKGIISPGGIGFDINCGVRLLASRVALKSIEKEIEALVHQISRDVPSGLGRGYEEKLSIADIEDILEKGVEWGVASGYASEEDLKYIEENGRFEGARAEEVSERAKQRGVGQVGTLGAGNHFLEVDEVVNVYDKKTAEAFGLFDGQLVILIHTGSRGLGHQVATDYMKKMYAAMPKYGISVPDRELAGAPFRSEEGQDYFAAMAAAANFAWMNRQMITAKVRGAYEWILGGKVDDLNLKLVYDVAHNIAKIEEYDGRKLVVHRKGATRCFPKGHPEVVEEYRHVGQPALIPGTMGTASYVMVGEERGLKISFGSTAHGAGRRMSRGRARKMVEGGTLRKDLEGKGIVIRVGSAKGLAEEAPEAYKDIEEVVGVVETTGIARRVVKLKPWGVVKG